MTVRMSEIPSQDDIEDKYHQSPGNAQNSGTFNVKTWFLDHKGCVMKCGAVVVCIIAIVAIAFVIIRSRNMKDLQPVQQGKNSISR